MWKRATLLAAAVVLASAGAQAANKWGLPGATSEEPSRFEGKVVDIACELTGNCPANCGDGKRQLGVVETSNDKLWLVIKNFDGFANAHLDVLPFCGKKIVVDGLKVETPHMPSLVIQFLKPAGDEKAKWIRAAGFSKDWHKRNPKFSKKQANGWFWHDDQIKDIIKRTGELGDPKLDVKKELEEN